VYQLIITEQPSNAELLVKEALEAASRAFFFDNQEFAA
jgi:hypothetical protein